MTPDTPSKQPLSWIEEVRRRAAALRFGQVILTIHEGCVIQLDVTEKTRFENQHRPTRKNETHQPHK